MQKTHILVVFNPFLTKQSSIQFDEIKLVHYIFLKKNLMYLGLDARKQVFGVCEQQRRKISQTGQRLCYSLFGKFHILTWNR